MRQKVLYIAAISDPLGGGMFCINRNHRLLHQVPSIDVVDYKVELQSNLSAIYSVITSGNFTISSKIEKEIIKFSIDNNIDRVFIEGSITGRLVKKLTQRGVGVFIFAHNVEKILYKQKALSSKIDLSAWLKYYLSYINEKRAIKYANKLIALTQRDSDSFVHEYGKKADVLIPISAKEVNSPFLNSNQSTKPYALFVGSNFFPNNEGINWFISEVMPYVNIELRVVGSCCSEVKNIPQNVLSKVKLMGVVPDLESVFREAACFVAPIFKGSGMKTKTIEALSYGKTIFGTTECFQGIECDFSKVGALCNDAESFIYSLNSSFVTNNDYSLNLFQERFSDNVVQKQFNELYK